MGSGFRRDGPVAVIGAVSTAHFLSHVYLLAYPPLFPILGRQFDVSIAQLGLLVTAIYLPTLVLQLPLGVMVDRIGAKRVLVGGLLVTALAIGASGFAPAYWVLLLCAFVSGIGQSVFHPADYALLDAVTEPHTEGTSFAVHTFAGYAGFAAAPAVIGGIGIAIDWRLGLFVAGGVGAVYAVALAVGLPAVYVDPAGSAADRGASLAETVEQMASYLREWDLVAVVAFYFLSMTAVVGLQSFTTVLAVDSYGLGESSANTLLTAHLTATAIGVLLGGPVANRLSFYRVIQGTFLVCAVGVWIAALGPWSAGFLAPLAVFVVVGLVLGSALPSRDRLANATGDPEEAGARFGFFFTGVSLGAVVSPAVLGWVIDVWSAPVAFVAVAAAFVLGAGMVAIIQYGAALRPLVSRAFG